MKNLLPTGENLMDKIAKVLPALPEKWGKALTWLGVAAIASVLLFAICGGLFGDTNPNADNLRGIKNGIGAKLFGLMLKALFGG